MKSLVDLWMNFTHTRVIHRIFNHSKNEKKKYDQKFLEFPLSLDVTILQQFLSLKN